MHQSRASRTRFAAVLPRLAAASVLALVALVPAAVPVLADGVTMTATAMLNGNVRPGTWSGVYVHLENDGPAVDGELRIGSSQQGDTTYGVAVQLPTGARQDHTLYAQPGFFGASFTITFVSNGTSVAEQRVKVTAHDAYSINAYVVAEKPEGIVADIRDSLTSPQFPTPSVLAIRPEDLPPRVEAWGAIDRLVWQDIDSSRLNGDQLEALKTWVSAGGRLVILGGTTGTTTVGSFPAEMLPYRPTLTVDASTADLATLVGTLPAGAASTPALAGILDRGTVLGWSGDHVIAAETVYGQGTVTIMGVDPATSWLARTDAATGLWHRLMPNSNTGVINPLAIPDDSALVNSLNNLPSVQLPSIDQLFLILLGYIALIGPINYFVLRRLDKREWAWVTMPVLVAFFAVGAYGFGISLKGTDIIVNELAIVRGAAGTDRGIGQVYIGVFSPTRNTYDVRVGGNALLSNPVSQQQQISAEQAIDVINGDPSHLRGYQVGFGVLRGFRAEASVASPLIDSDLRVVESRLQGTIINRSDMALQSVAVVFGGGLQMLGDVAAGETREIDFDIISASNFQQQLSERMFGTTQVPDTATARTIYTRRTVIDQLSYYSGKLATSTGPGSSGPVILAWGGKGPLSVDLGVETQSVGDTLYMLPAQATISGRTVFVDDLIRRTVAETDALDAWDQGGGSYSLGSGTMTIELRPVGFSGDFQIEQLELGMTQGEQLTLRGGGSEVEPLPAGEQPAQDDPMTLPEGAAAEPTPSPSEGAGAGGDPAAPAVPVDPAPPDGRPGDEFFDGIPELQLFDRMAGKWMEFPHFASGTPHVIKDATRYIDRTGTLLVRFVNRLDQGQSVYFTFQTRMVGDVA